VTATELEQVVITASRQAEKVVDAPASVAVVPSDVVAARPALTSTDHIRTLPGIDVSSGGLLQSNVVARGSGTRAHLRRPHPRAMEGER